MLLHNILSFDAIAIQCHDNPDADSIASGFALYSFCKAAGKKVKLFYAGRNTLAKPNLCAMVALLAIPLEHEPVPAAWDGLLVTVDCQYGAGNVTRVSASQVAVIDHHIQERELPELFELRPYLGSCSTLVWLMLAQEQRILSPQVSTALFYGLYSDTNSFAEIRHPSDRDMRDTLEVDERILKTLKRSNLSLDDLAMASAALNALEYHPEGRFVIIGVPSCDPNILGFISDLAMQVDAVDVALVFSSQEGAYKFSIRTGIREVKASELAVWLTDKDIGSGGGHTEKAGGSINKANYEGLYGEHTFFDYCLGRLRAYLGAYDFIDCATGNGVTVQGVLAYEKLPALVGYVPCCDLFPDKTSLHIRMLEGDIDIQVSPDTYLLIGTAGEIYPIGKAKFLASYTPSERVFSLDVAYPPVVLDKDTGTRVYLFRVARSATSQKSRVSARQLTRGLKIFTTWDSEHYFKGEPGDWVAIRNDDPTDAYIIKADIFPSLYVCVEGMEGVLRT